MKLFGVIPLPRLEKVFALWATFNVVTAGVKADVDDSKAIDGVKLSDELAPGYSSYKLVMADLPKAEEVTGVDVAGLYGSEDEVVEADEVVDLSELSGPTLVTADLPEAEVIIADESEEDEVTALDGSEYHVTDTDQVIDLSELKQAPGNSSSCPISPTVLQPLAHCPVSNITLVQAYLDACLNAIGTPDQEKIEECMEVCADCCYNATTTAYVDCNPLPPPSPSSGSSARSSFPAYAGFALAEFFLIVVPVTVAYRCRAPLNLKSQVIGWGSIGAGIVGAVCTILSAVTQKYVAPEGNPDSVVILASIAGIVLGAGVFSNKARNQLIENPRVAAERLALINAGGNIQVHEYSCLIS